MEKCIKIWHYQSSGVRQNQQPRKPRKSTTNFQLPRELSLGLHMNVWWERDMGHHVVAPRALYYFPQPIHPLCIYPIFTLNTQQIYSRFPFITKSISKIPSNEFDPKTLEKRWAQKVTKPKTLMYFCTIFLVILFILIYKNSWNE